MSEQSKHKATPEAQAVIRHKVSAPHDGAGTLDEVVEIVRGLMRADTASVASFSLPKKTVTWHAASGFRRHHVGAGGHEIVSPLSGSTQMRAAAATDEIMIFENIGLSDAHPASDFPLHSAEEVINAALVPLRARGECLGALIIGHRSAHVFTAEEKTLLQGLAGMAALALDNARLLEVIGASKRMWEQTFDAIPDGIILHDAGMIIRRCNHQAAEGMGMTPATVVGRPCAEGFARMFGERAAANHMKQHAGTASAFELQSENGRRFLVSLAPLDSSGDAEQKGWSVITWSDVTELSEMQDQLSRSRKLATIGQLAAGVAHEINNPLAAITTCAEATLRDLRASPELAKAAAEHEWDFYLEEIVRQALRCKGITRGLLDLARQRRARREACDINRVAENTVRLFARRAPGAVQVEVECDRGIGEVATDEGMLRQTLDNLLSNALDSVGGAGRITVRTRAQGDERVCVEVSDTGAGIKPEIMVRIFEPFFTTKETGQGSGLGLALCSTFAETLGGRIAVESKPGAGSTFRLWLPRRAPELPKNLRASGRT